MWSAAYDTTYLINHVSKSTKLQLLKSANKLQKYCSLLPTLIYDLKVAQWPDLFSLSLSLSLCVCVYLYVCSRPTTANKSDFTLSLSLSLSLSLYIYIYIYIYIQSEKKFRIQSLRVCRGDKMKPFSNVTNIWQVLRFLARGPWRVWRRMVLQKLLKMLGNYITFIRDILPEMLENVPLQVRQRLWFQHDGAPAHFALHVRKYLNNVFLNRWNGRDGSVQWPPRSPNLTPMDFFIWGEMKCLVYKTLQKSWLPVWQKLQQLFVRDTFAHRYQLCINVNGQHFQQLL